jgi:hypothetical protein
LLGSGRVPEYPEPNQEEETQNHQDYAEIQQEDESACRIELLVGLPNFGAHQK